MDYVDREKTIERLTADDYRISESAPINQSPTSTYIARVRIAHESANVPPVKCLRTERCVKWGERYVPVQVPESWEDIPMGLSTNATLEAVANTQAGEDKAEQTPTEISSNINPENLT